MKFELRDLLCLTGGGKCSDMIQENCFFSPDEDDNPKKRCDEPMKHLKKLDLDQWVQ